MAQKLFALKTSVNIPETIATFGNPSQYLIISFLLFLILSPFDKGLLFGVRSPRILPDPVVFSHQCFKSLSLTADGKILCELYSILLSGSWERFQSYMSSHSEKLVALGVSDLDLVSTKMRVHLLKSLGTRVTIYSFESLKELLGFDKDEDLERFIVEAVTSNFIVAKINQLGRSVEFSPSFSQSHLMTLENWELLSDKISQWKNSIAMVQEARYNAYH